MKILSIIVPAYNVGKYLNEVLPTYVSSSLENAIEVIIVNDGSKDDTLDIANNYCKKYPSIFKVLDKENGGHGSTINAGLKVAVGKYVKVIDGDDWVTTKNLEKLVQVLNDTDVDIIINPFIQVNEVNKKEILIKDDAFSYEKVYNVDDVFSSIDRLYQIHSVTFNRKVLENIPLITENCFYVDQQYVSYPLKFAKNVIFLDFPVYNYRVGNSGQSVAIKNQQKNRAMLKTVAKSLSDYIVNNNMSDGARNFIAVRVAGMIFKIYRVYLAYGPNKEKYNEWLECKRDIGFNKFVFSKFTSLEKKLFSSNSRLLFYGLATIYRLKLIANKKL